MQRKGTGAIILSVAVILLVVAWMRERFWEPEASEADAPLPVASSSPVAFDDIVRVIERRCLPCHHAGGWETDAILDTPDGILAVTQVILWNTVENHYMPPGNLTGMTLEERELLRRWIDDVVSP